MTHQALACPFCRTWFEGSGRSVKCPACGRRFDADKARLETSPSIATDRPDDQPAHVEPPSWGDASSPEDARDEMMTTMDTGDQQVQGRPNLGMLFTIVLLALLFLGPRFLDGGFIIAGFVVILIARWLYGRWQAGSSTG